MTDAVKLVRKVLLADTGVAALVGTNVFAGVLPEHYDPSSVVGTSGEADGPAVVLTVRGGTVDSEMPVQYVSVQTHCWAGVNDFVRARKLYNAVLDALHGFSKDYGTDGRIASCLAETIGQDMVDPDAGWSAVIGAFKIILI